MFWARVVEWRVARETALFSTLRRKSNPIWLLTVEADWRFWLCVPQEHPKKKKKVIHVLKGNVINQQHLQTHPLIYRIYTLWPFIHSHTVEFDLCSFLRSQISWWEILHLKLRVWIHTHTHTTIYSRKEPCFDSVKEATATTSLLCLLRNHAAIISAGCR